MSAVLRASDVKGTAMTTSSQSIENEILEFGRNIFRLIGKQQPSAFDKNYIPGKIMEWSMTKPDFKLNMFRLVDVLPSLSSSEAIARHVNEYLSVAAKDIHGLVEWGVNVNPESLRAKLTAFAVKRSVTQMARMFIAGEDAASAMKHLRSIRKSGMAFTVDLLGEYSVSEQEGLHYLKRYLDALTTFEKERAKWEAFGQIIEGHPGCIRPINVSVKLSALYSQCEILNFDTSVEVLSERLGQIARKAQSAGAQMYVDAEDTSRNPIILETFKRVFASEEFRDMPYPGIVIQAYAKDSLATVDSMLEFAKKRGNPIAVRLVKGAYWDSETVSSNQQHLASPLFAKKESSDAQYELLSRRLLDSIDLCLPAFGSHNVRSLSHACCYARAKGISTKQFELQMLYGMADPIAKAFTGEGYLTRLYVPLGEMLPGMGYLVRRLLENTSNESFLKHTFADESSFEKLLSPPNFVEPSPASH
jgi:RHH-type transcriptional regulator, proline utilization regulon repressor / proline dehydrogenase / delta 1-pyrroline-5-carboxylate dehydrogenase